MNKADIMMRDIAILKIIPLLLTTALIFMLSFANVHATTTPTPNTSATSLDQSKALSAAIPASSNQFVAFISNPTVAYLLVLLGIYGVFFELLHPGLILPGTVGVISLLLALYAFQLLPINYNGLGLIVLGIAFIISEGFTPSLGILGLAGTILFVIGSTMLMNSGQTQIAWSVIALMGVINLLLFVVLVGAVLKSRKQTIKNGLITLVGATGRSLGDINPEGQAVIRGEIWSVQAQTVIKADKPLRVVNANGLILEVIEDSTWD